tara:strand:+ start:15 stop:284 length:270 start_codon:yes stop_codon:yes gene_type:complete
MRDLSSPLGVSMFDGEKPPKKSRARRKAVKKHAKMQKQHAKKTKSKFGEARGISTKAEDKKKVYCKPGRQLDKSCAGADPRGFKESGRN